MKVLVISGHPHLENSIANATIINELKTLDNIEVRDLGALYPDLNINVAAEQEALLAADVIIWQFPVYWYSVPSLLKKWQEDVFAHGFAYGSNAKLGGKKFIVSGTTGSPVEVYNPGQAQNYTLDTLFTPYRQSANLCNLEYVETFHFGAAMFIPGVSKDEDRVNIINRAKEHAKTIIAKVKSL